MLGGMFLLQREDARGYNKTSLISTTVSSSKYMRELLCTVLRFILVVPFLLTAWRAIGISYSLAL
jgi:hypothetical protein